MGRQCPPTPGPGWNLVNPNGFAASDFYTDAFLYHGTYSDTAPELYGDNPATCTATSSTTATCKGSINIYPTDADPKIADADTWNVAAEAVAFNGQDQQNPDMSKVGYKDQSGLSTTLVQRYSKLTTTVSSTSVYKGKTFTASGKPSRADWDDNLYHGYANQPVKLQFRNQDGVHGLVRQPEDQCHRELQRLLALLLRRHHDDPGGQRHGCLRGREVVTT
ncbi:hypothetical protein ABZ636_36755 [Streptomyces sp. NPDC007251]|uniref:hypothetical protein n=1 Tax=Streptomyces sp. NPDC007251 TaxID=3154483 RepID=UPI0033DC6E42